MRGELLIGVEAGEEKRVELSKSSENVLSITAAGDFELATAVGEVPDQAVNFRWDKAKGSFVIEPVGARVQVGDTLVNRAKPFFANRSCNILVAGRTVRLELRCERPRHEGREISTVRIGSLGEWEFGRGEWDQAKPGVSRVVLDEESRRISGVHAELSVSEEGHLLRDVSRYGTYLNGERFTEQWLVYGDRFRIGEYVFEFLVNEIRRVDDEPGGEIVARGVGKRVQAKNPETGKKESRAILSNVDLDIANGEFVGILGGSGQGKSTLMNCLCGIALPTEGKVTVNGVSVLDRKALKEAGIGFVPQEDIVHRELTVDQALYFGARLKLNLPRSAARNLVDSVMVKLGLEEHREKLVGRLSGGQRKRVSIAAELLARPRVLFLDEPGSGLDPATEFELMSLLQSLAATGMTVVCTTHVLENAHLFDRLLWVQGGRVVFSGNHRQARDYFLGSGWPDETTESTSEPVETLLGLPKLANLVRIYKSLADTQESAVNLEDRFRSSPYFSEPKNSCAVREPEERIPHRSKVGFWRTLWYLVARESRILGSDPWNLVFLMAQAVVIALLISWVADGPVLRGFLAVIATLWFGCSNGAQKIVGELPVFQRERVSGQSRNAYIASKIAFLSFVTLVQAFCLLAVMLGSALIFHGQEETPGRDQRVSEMLREKLFPVSQRTLSPEEEEKLLLGAFDDVAEARVTKEGLLESPNLPGIFFGVSDPGGWRPGATVESPVGESLRLPQKLPPHRALPFPSNSVRPGMAESPYSPGSWKVFGELEKDLWIGGETVRCPLTGQEFMLPSRLPNWPDETLKFRLAKALVVWFGLEEVVLDSDRVMKNKEMKRRDLEPSPELNFGKALGWPSGLLLMGFSVAAMIGVCLGLSISALVNSPTQAVMWVPLVLIPQILFGGVVVTYPEMTAPVRAVSRYVPSFACQRVLDVSHVFGRLVPRTANQAKMPVFLGGGRETVKWTEPGGKDRREYYDRPDDRNVSWQNLLVMPDRVGERSVEKTSELIYDQRGALKRRHEMVPNTVAYREDLRYGYIQGVRYVYIGEAQRSALVLLGWLGGCLGLIHFGLFQKERIR